MTEATLCFIGAGNMASAMIGGLIAGGHSPANIIACDINPEALNKLSADFVIRTETDLNNAVKSADCVILSVKPQVMQSVCAQISNTSHQPLFISIAAGLRESDINGWLGGHQALVRCMPNTPALLRLGASGLFANPAVSDAQKQLAQTILQSIGLAVWVDEEAQLDAVTAISGSGPAYFFYFIEALEQAALQLGLAKDLARDLSRQTALGAATMTFDEDAAELRRKVTSPGGTTERAIASFQADGLMEMVAAATRAASERSRELAEILANPDD